MSEKEKIEELLTRGVENVIDKKVLEQKLKSGKKLRVKHGVDPTTKDLHIGYAVVYNKLQELQEMGHQIVFLIGDFTARFGDPTDQGEHARKLRDAKEVREMAKNYIDQLGKILDLKKTEIRYNSEWYDKMKADELLLLMSHFTAPRMLERDMFQERLKKGETIGLHEPVYPVLQAYDSVMLESDLTVIGNDQTFNELKARDIQKDYGQEPQDVVAMEILVGLDGKQKMSQSLGNYIGITEDATTQFGKTMSIPDELIVHYFKLATRVPSEEISRIEKELKTGANPRDIKARLAFEIVKLYHGDKEAKKAEEEFTKIFARKEKPTEMPEVKADGKKLIDILVENGLVASKSEARRLATQKAIKKDDKVVTDLEFEAEKGVYQVGKRRFIKVV
ncbi:MAG: tyrosine--tRNA ligase [Patescibacteria group bacterium]|nr:tyrosine--tRNA ligase [Patescibacteria group bacterium]